MAKLLIFYLILVQFSPFILGKLEPWELGPFVKDDSVNPIMGPRNDTAFFCPVRSSFVLWEAKDVFNPTAIVKDGKVHMLYRAEDFDGQFKGTSRIGLAISDDGLHFERMTQPIFYPNNDQFVQWEWEGGVKDPRIVKDDYGTYFMTYSAYDGTLARLFVASSTDLINWTKHGSIWAAAENGKYIDLWSKSGSIITRREGNSFIATKINGKYWMYWGESNIYMAWSEDLINWIPLVDTNGGGGTEFNLTIVFGPREGKFDSDIVEPGPQSVIMEESGAILLIYNSRNKHPDQGGDPELPLGTYSAGQILLNISEPWTVVERMENHFIKPDKDYEVIGQVNNVVFVEGLVHYLGKWFLYYGTADSKIAVAVIHEETN